MGIFRLGHKHVSPETLSEYLDGRLRSQARERLESVVSGCADCRRELEGLRDTVAMLRQLPVVTPRRSFVMAAPPVEARQAVPRARPIFSFRPPQWTYAGAASLAALALAVLVSVDASGLVAPALPDTVILRQEITPGATVESGAETQESAIATGGAAEALSIQVERETAVEAPAATAAAAPAQAPPVAVMEAQAPAAAEVQAETLAEKSLEAPAIQLQAVEEPAVKSAQREQAVPPTTAKSAPAQLELASDTKPEAVEESAAPTAVSAVSDGVAPEPVRVQETPIPADEPAAIINPGTPLIWRLLEAATAVLFLVLAAVIFLRRRASRRF